jgi:hypothetical protein
MRYMIHSGWAELKAPLYKRLLLPCGGMARSISAHMRPEKSSKSSGMILKMNPEACAWCLSTLLTQILAPLGLSDHMTSLKPDP